MTRQFRFIPGIITAILLFFTFSASAQDFKKVDHIVRQYPSSFSSINKLADKIKTDFSREDEKARAIFTWIALHVKYDLAGAKAIATKGPVAYSYSSMEEKLRKEYEFRLGMAEKAFKSKKAVCQGYSSLFRALCEMTGLKCMDITGTSKVQPMDIGKLPKASDHMWNAVKIGDDWKLVDVTWGAGSVDGNTGKFMQRFNDAYFFTSPELFFLNHFPDDKRQMMLSKTEQEFADLPLFYGEYLRSDYELLFPEKGILSMAGANVIPFKFADLPQNVLVTWSFSSNRISHEAKPVWEGNVASFDVPVTPASKGYLTIFVEGRAIVTFKVTR